MHTTDNTTTPAMADPTELLTNALRDCASALAYAAFNIDGKTLDDLDPRLSDSTDVSASCLIAERSARAALAEAKRAALARRADQPVAEMVAELPPLPEDHYMLLPQRRVVFDADHMRQYARDAIAASRRAAGGDARQTKISGVSAFWMDSAGRISFCIDGGNSNTELANGQVLTVQRNARGLTLMLDATPASAGQAELDAQLRKEVAIMYQMLDAGEWADNVASTPDGQCLETAITKLVGKANSAGQAGQVARELSKAEIDAIVYKCRQDGNDTTYDIVRAAISADRAARSAAQSTAQVSTEQAGDAPGEGG